MRAVIVVLLFAAALRLVHGGAHGGSNCVGVEDDQSIGVARGAADRLDQARLAAQEPLLVRVENRDQTHLRQIQSLAQEVDTDEHVVFAEPQVADELHALDRRDIRVHVPHAQPQPLHVLRQILGHTLGQRRHEHALTARGARADLVDEVVDLPRDGAHLHARVEQPRRADHLLDDLVGAAALILARRRGDKHRLMKPLLELLKAQRAVVKRARQAEAVLHQALLAGAVAVVHGAHLRERDVALVDKEDEVIGEIVHQRHRRGAGCAPGDDAGVVLDAGAVPQLAHHLHVVARALLNALRLDELAVLLEVRLALGQLALDLLRGALHLLVRGDVVARGIDGHMVDDPLRRAGDGVNLGDAVDLVAEELHPDGVALRVDGVDLHRVAADAEHVALEGDVVAVIADLHELAQQLVARVLPPLPQGDDHVRVVDGVAQSVDARDGRDDDHVAPLEERRRGAVAQALNLGVDGGVLFNKGIRVGDVRLGLVVVVVGDEVFDGVIRKKRAELLAQLRRERLVVRQHERRPLDLLDDLGHGIGLAAAGHAQQHLLTQAVLQPLGQRLDRLRLVAARRIVRYNLEFRHSLLLSTHRKIRTFIPFYHNSATR